MKKVSVHSDTPNFQVSASYVGDKALELAREFAVIWSRHAKLTLTYEQTVEIYEKGELKTVEELNISRNLQNE